MNTKRGAAELAFVRNQIAPVLRAIKEEPGAHEQFIRYVEHATGGELTGWGISNRLRHIQSGTQMPTPFFALALVGFGRTLGISNDVRARPRRKR